MKKRDELKVTVAIPCYNGEEYINQVIESILNQTRSSDEILVIDDGSTDKSANLVERYAKRHERVKLISHYENKGIAFARNTALQHAENDVIVYIDVDVQADPQFIASILNEYTDEKVAGVGGQGIESNIRNVYDRWRKLHASQGSGSQIKRNTGMLWGLCSSYRRKVLAEIGGFDTFYRTNAEDVDIGIRIRGAGYRLVYSPDAIVYHQRSDGFRSLHNMIYRWYYWGYIAHKRNGKQPFLSFGYIVFRNLMVNGIKDLIARKSIKLTVIDLTMFLVELWVIIRGALSKVE
jgi:glycosyltransferase involved in cell wall biosynthesis